jgi:hypothetical protein
VDADVLLRPESLVGVGAAAEDLGRSRARRSRAPEQAQKGQEDAPDELEEDGGNGGTARGRCSPDFAKEDGGNGGTASSGVGSLAARR